jgi:DNA repair exonuclease SbcCD nuclease subunit
MISNILVIGDIHVKVNNIKEINMLLEKVKQTIKDHDIKMVVFLGDISDSFDVMHVLSWKCIVNLVYSVSHLCKTILIVGNHDYINNKQHFTDNHFYSLFSKLAGVDVKVVDKPHVELFLNKKLLFLPYIPNGKFLDSLKDFEISEIDMIFCHQEFFGSKMGPIESTKGDKYPENYPLVISGHIHDRQMPQGNIIYIGTPMPHSFGCENNGNVSVFSINDSDQRPIENVIDLHMPKKITLNIKAKDFFKFSLPDEINSYRLKVSGTNKDILKIRMSDEYTELIKKAKIMFEPTDAIEKNRKIINKPFMQIFEDMVKKEDSSGNMLKILENIQKRVREIK